MMVNMNLMMNDLKHQLVVEVHVLVYKNLEEQLDVMTEKSVTKLVELKVL
jgi:uncharacterized protein YheU (UPF0270 family)